MDTEILTREQVQKEFNQNGLQISEEQADTIIQFIVEIATIAVTNYLDNCSGELISAKDHSE